MKCSLCSDTIDKGNDYNVFNSDKNKDEISCGQCFTLLRIFETLREIKNVLGEEELSDSENN